jgi:methyltransferase (TIGR00027 family)
MSQLTAVSETALLTLKSRVIESEKKSPLLEDPKGKEILDKIQKSLPEETKQRVLDRKYSPALTSYIALRARKFDACAREFLEERKGLVVSLGCGFDTRFWRISRSDLNYVEVDLPEVIDLKKELVGADPGYPMIGCSVLDFRWITEIAALQKNNVLFLSEGLFMYLPEADIVALFKKLASTFHHSQLVFEAVHRKYTGGFRKKMVEQKMKRNSGTTAGSSFTYGIRKAEDIEDYADNIQVLEEWSHFEDPDIKPRFMQVLKHFKAFTRTQWTVRADIK